MPSGRLAAITPPANTDTLLYTATAVTTCTVSAVGRVEGDSPRVRLALTSGGLGTLAAADWIEHDAPLAYGAPLERSGIVLAAGQSLVVRTSTASVSFVAWGVE